MRITITPIADVLDLVKVGAAFDLIVDKDLDLSDEARVTLVDNIRMGSLAPHFAARKGKSGSEWVAVHDCACLGDVVSAKSAPISLTCSTAVAHALLVGRLADKVVVADATPVAAPPVVPTTTDPLAPLKP